jgi:hypothetical protein
VRISAPLYTGKGVPYHAKMALLLGKGGREGRGRVTALHILLLRCCNGMVSQHSRLIRHAQVILPTGKRPETHYAQGCVDFGADLDGFSPSSPLQDTIPTMLMQPPICYYYNVSTEA